MGPYPFIHLFYHHSEYLQGTRLHSVHRSESESCLGLERSHFIENGGAGEPPAGAVKVMGRQRWIVSRSRGNKALKDGFQILA